MSEIQIKLAGVWVVVMLIYLWGDVLRLMSGDFTPGEIVGKPVSQGMWLGISALMLIPILMVFLSLMLDQPVNRWANIIVAAGFFVLNVTSIRTYPSAYDQFLLAVSLVFNAVTIWFAWNWIE
jgi:hypothetical protein